jgi:hypothetical protein
MIMLPELEPMKAVQVRPQEANVVLRMAADRWHEMADTTQNMQIPEALANIMVARYAPAR